MSIHTLRRIRRCFRRSFCVLHSAIFNLQSAIVFLFLSLCLAAPAQAELIEGVTATASSYHDGAWVPGYTVDNSGMSDKDAPHTVNYSEDPHKPTHGTGFSVSSTLSDMWVSKGGDTTGWITFTFDTVQTIAEFAVWNHLYETARGIQTLNVQTSTDGSTFTDQISPVSGTTTWSFARADQGTGAGEGFTLSSKWTDVMVVRFDIESNWGDTQHTGLSEVRFYTPKPGIISLSSPVSATIIAGGTGKVGATVENTIDPATGGDMAYTLTGAIASGGVGEADPGSGVLAPGETEANTVFVTSSNVGLNTVTLTATSAGATNSPKSIDATLTVLAHSDAKFVAGTGGTQTLSSLDNALLVDFGSVARGAGSRTANLSLLNFESVSGYTVGLDLDAFDFSGNDAVLALDEAAALYGTPFKNMAAGAGHSLALHLTFDTTILGTYLATYTFKLSDQNLSGASAEGSETLILTVKGTVTPEPATLALLGLGGLGMLLARKRK